MNSYLSRILLPVVLLMGGSIFAEIPLTQDDIQSVQTTWVLDCLKATGHPSMLLAAVSSIGKRESYTNDHYTPMGPLFRFHKVHTRFAQKRRHGEILGYAEVCKNLEEGESVYDYDGRPRSVVIPGLFKSDGTTLFLSEQTLVDGLFSKLPKDLLKDEAGVKDIIQTFAECRGMWIQDVRPDDGSLWKGDFRDDEEHSPPLRSYPAKNGDGEDWTTRIEKTKNGWSILVTLARSDDSLCNRYQMAVVDGRLSVLAKRPVSMPYDWLEACWRTDGRMVFRGSPRLFSKEQETLLLTSLFPKGFLPPDCSVFMAVFPRADCWRGGMALPHGDERDWLSQEPPKSVVSVLVGFADGRHVLLKDDGTVLEHFFSDIPDEMVGTPEAVRELVRAFAILRAKWIQDDFPDSVGKWKAKTFNEEQYKLPPERHLEKLVERRKQEESIDPDVFLPPRPDIFKKTKESFEERFQQRVDWDKKHEYREWSWAACFLMSLGDKENWSFHADRTENGWRVRTPLSALDCRATIQYTFVIENGKMNVERRVLIYSPFTEGTPRELPKTAKQQTP